MEVVFDMILFVFYGIMILYSLIVIILPIIKFLNDL